MFELPYRLRILLLAFLLSVNGGRGENAVVASNAPPLTNQLPSPVGRSEVVVISPPSPPSPSRAENERQRRLLLGLMVVLVVIAVWRRIRRRL